MTKVRTHRIRLEPNNRQSTLLFKTAGCSRLAYNTMLAYHKELYEADKENNKFNAPLLKRYWNAKKKEFNFINDVVSQHAVIDSAYDGIKNAYTRFFKKLSGYPKFKRKRDSDYSFSLSNTEVKLDYVNNKIRLSKKHGWIKLREAFRFNESDVIGNITISRGGNDWYVSITYSFESPTAEKQGIVGIDLGISNMAITSDGEVFGNLRITKSNAVKLKRLNQELARRTKGGKNWYKTVYKLRKHYKRISDVRSDYTHKLTSYLANEYHTVCIEDLNVKGMVKNRHLSKAIADVNFGELRRQLEYKCNNVVVVPRFFASSKICSKCGYIYNPTDFDNVKWNLGIREWTCPHCNILHDRDINAAINILNKGKEMINSSASSAVSKNETTAKSKAAGGEVDFCVVTKQKI